MPGKLKDELHAWAVSFKVIRGATINFGSASALTLPVYNIVASTSTQSIINTTPPLPLATHTPTAPPPAAPHFTSRD